MPMIINNWEDWTKVYMDANAFKPIIKEILKRHHLPYTHPIIPMGFSTNAVFKVDDVIVKIFAPKESSANTPHDYHVELNAMALADTLVMTPKVLGNGLIKGKYDFYYIVTNYIDGAIAKDYFKALSQTRRFEFGHQIRGMLESLKGIQPPVFFETISKRYLIHQKYKDFNESFKDELFQTLKDYSLPNTQFVHGDITEDNIIVKTPNDLYLIDFADSAIGPISYEYPPIVYGLFDMDIEAFKGFIQDEQVDCHLERLYEGTIIHEYGGDFIKMFLKRIDQPLEALNHLDDFKQLLFKTYKK
jgi:aminoglycoside phosphotransferase (APT) family kinase protein